MIHWLTTANNPRHPSAEPKGWKLHAVEAAPDAKFTDIKRQAAACGLRGRYGWDMDLFVEDRCKRCQAKLGVDS